MGLAPLHQGAQVERPERASVPAGIQPHTSVPAGERGWSPCSALRGSEQWSPRWSGVLVSPLASLGGRGLEAGRGGKVPGLRCLFLPPSSPFLYFGSHSLPALHQVSLLTFQEISLDWFARV